jgi:hypothetical protein
MLRDVSEANAKSLMAYAPEAYPGRIALFRARVQPLFRRYAADLG